MTYQKRKFTPLQKSDRVYNLAGFDIETYGDDNDFYMGSVYYDEGIEVFYNIVEMKEFILNNLKGYILFAHNLQFDIKIFWDEIYKGEMYILKSKTGLIMARYPNTKIRNTRDSILFYDTMNFLNTSLFQLAKCINMDKLESPECMGRLPRNKREKRELEIYNINDSKITYKFACMIQDFYNNLGIKLKPTLSSCAMTLFRTRFNTNTYLQAPKQFLPFIYNSYAGGRTEIFKRGHVTNLYDYDVNSMYPYVMKEYPYPLYKNVYKDYSKKYLKHEGFSEVIITAPNQYIPYLHNRQDKLLFPIGKFKGVYTNYELRTAKKRGYNIKIIRSYIFPHVKYIFNDYVDFLYKKRMEAKKNDDIRELFYKLNLNSLYGKFAQKITNKIEVISMCKLTKQKVKHIFDHGYKLHTENGFAFITDILGHKYPNFIMPFWSSYVTAYARTELYNHFENTGFDNVYYCDTDSIFTDKRFKTSSELGKLKLEKKIKKGILIKPKMYRIDEKVRVKGCRINTVDEFQELLRKGTTDYDTFIKIGSALRYGKKLNQKVNVTKRLSFEDDKRKWSSLFNPLELQDSTPKHLNTN